MAMDAIQERITADEFFALPQDDDRHFELLDGVIVVNEPNARHQIVVTRFLVELSNWIAESDPPARGRAWPPLDVRIDDYNVFAPDVLWVCEQRLDRDALYPFRSGDIPDLAIEVRSPSTWHRDIGHKQRWYSQRGFAELWLVDPIADGVSVFRRSAPDAAVFDVSLDLVVGETLTSPLLPEFALELATLFAS